MPTYEEMLNRLMEHTRKEMDRREEWRRMIMERLRRAGVSFEEAGVILGILMEEHMRIDMHSYNRGYDNGYREGTKS